MNCIMVILGCPRSGKTTLTKLVVEKCPGSIIISLDCIYYSIKNTYPELKIDEYKTISELSKKLVSFIENIISEYRYNFPNNNIIVEGMELMPSDVINSDAFAGAKILCLGYPFESKDRVFYNIRKFDNSCVNSYTSEMLDEELLKRIEFYLKFSNTLLRECNRYEIRFFDVQHNRDEKLREALGYLLDNK